MQSLGVFPGQLTVAAHRIALHHGQPTGLPHPFPTAQWVNQLSNLIHVQSLHLVLRIFQPLSLNDAGTSTTPTPRVKPADPRWVTLADHTWAKSVDQGWATLADYWWVKLKRLLTWGNRIFSGSLSRPERVA
jgi:hypothetical protein